MSNTYIAIHNKSLLARGDLQTVVRKAKQVEPNAEPYLFCLENGKRIDIDWRGQVEEVIGRLPDSLLPPIKKRGRPKLGVVSKEVTLLPEHWEWLSVQRGGASITLRRLIDSAMDNTPPAQQRRIKQDQLYNLMRVFEDDAGFEAATRALYRLDEAAFADAIRSWPGELQGIYTDKLDAILTIGK